MKHFQIPITDVCWRICRTTFLTKSASIQLKIFYVNIFCVAIVFLLPDPILGRGILEYRGGPESGQRQGLDHKWHREKKSLKDERRRVLSWPGQEWDEECRESDDRRLCMKDYQFCLF